VHAEQDAARRGFRRALDALYLRYNQQRYRASDPVEILHHYPDPRDREWIGLVAATLAYGRVASIRSSVRDAANRLGERPSQFIRTASTPRLHAAMHGFRHRWTTGAELAALLAAARNTANPSQSLGESLATLIHRRDPSIRPALIRWTAQLRDAGAGRTRLWADPGGPSACKRLHLYLRWMVRHDQIDVGAWSNIPPRLLLVPVDTHMLRIGRALGFTSRRTADARATEEITAGFALIRPHDPARYDFALTRPGILTGLNPDLLPPPQNPAQWIRSLPTTP
jgi:uncharacterized protein (TIGR02757 family)